MTAQPAMVKSDAAATTDAHERGRDFLGETELERLLAAAGAVGMIPATVC